MDFIYIIVFHVSLYQKEVYNIYNIIVLISKHSEFKGGVSKIAMLYRTNLLALVGNKEISNNIRDILRENIFELNYNLDNNILFLYDDNQDKIIAEIRVDSTITNIHMERERYIKHILF